MLAWLIWILAVVSPARSDSFTAKVYDIHSVGDPGASAFLYTLESSETQEGARTKVQSAFKTPDGKLVAAESAETDGGKLVKYTVDEPVSSERGEVAVHDGKAYFSYTVGAGTADAKTKTDDEKASDRLLVPPTTIPFIRANWDTILKGDDVEARVAAPDREESFGFKFFKSGEEKRDGRDVVIVTMKPSSFFVAAIVKPMTFVIDRETRKVLEFRGRIVPKREGKDQDARIVYEK